MKNYTTWLKTASIVQFITAMIHAVSLFITPAPNNETEKQLFSLMDTYQFDFGAGFHRTMNELVLVFSASFCLINLLGGLLNWYLLRKKVAPEIMKGVITINLVIFGTCFVLITKYAFLPPIILSGLLVLFLVFARITIGRK